MPGAKKTSRWWLPSRRGTDTFDVAENGGVQWSSSTPEKDNSENTLAASAGPSTPEGKEYTAAAPILEGRREEGFWKRLLGPQQTSITFDEPLMKVPSKKSPYAEGVWAQGMGTLPASMSEADLTVSARRGDREYRFTRRSRERNGGRCARRESDGKESDDLPPGPIACVVVDNDFTSLLSKETDDTAVEGEKGKGVPGESETSPERGRHSSEMHTEMDSSLSRKTRSDKSSNLRKQTGALVVLQRKVIDAFKSFADLSFPDKDKEMAFQREQWFSMRGGAILASLYILVCFASTSALQRPYTLFHQIAYTGFCAFFTIPLPFLVFFNVPLRSQQVYQWALLGASWVWAFVFIVELRRCHFFGTNNTCYGRRYLDLFATVQGLPALALIALRQNRVLHILAATVWFALALSLFRWQEGVPGMFWRNISVSELFNIFFAGWAYFRERSDRQLFTLRQQLKEQYSAVQSAQAMERSAEHSKKRFVSYIFHEVRVPLNTARLALTNLDGESAFKDMSDDHKDLILGLDGSLRMMEKVLNDVLSFNRMESGNLVLAHKPFRFHKAVQLVGLAHRPTADVVGLDFELDLDPRIDTVSPVVLGDEMRLRQICSNLISNALKFTQKGGVKLVTKLLYPEETDSEEKEGQKQAVIRVEVHDTGVGLSLEDVRDNRLFSPYVQTEIGRRQGGKGSGLGLALITQIVKLSKGRLGVDSEPEKGSVFWFELPYTTAAVDPHDLSPAEEVGHAFPFGRRESTPSEGSVLSGGPRRGSATLSERRDSAPGHLSAGYKLEPKKAPESLSRPGSRGSSSLVASHAFSPSSGDVSPTAAVTPGKEDLVQISTALESPTSPVFNGGPARETAPLIRDGGSAARLNPTMVLPRISPAPRSLGLTPGQTVLPPSPAFGSHGTSLSPEPLSTMVVDDDSLTRKLMARMLKRLGHKVVQAEDGQSALSLILASWRGEGPPLDMVFLDNQMPLMFGHEVVRELRAAGCNTYIVGCTGNALREDQDEYLSAGANAVIPKPVHEAAIREQVEIVRELKDKATWAPGESRRGSASTTAMSILERRRGSAGTWTERRGSADTRKSVDWGHLAREADLTPVVEAKEADVGLGN